MHVGARSHTYAVVRVEFWLCGVTAVTCPSRASDREAALAAALQLLQQFSLDMDKFLLWLTEAETTCNVLIDATNKERLQEQPAAKNLLVQWKVGPPPSSTWLPLPRMQLRLLWNRFSV